MIQDYYYQHQKKEEARREDEITKILNDWI